MLGMSRGVCYWLAFAALGFVSCKTGHKLNAPASQFSFLQGYWVSTTTDGILTTQSWKKTKAGSMVSETISVQHRRDTISRDLAELQVRGDAFYFIPYTDEGHKLAIPFKVTAYSDTSFTAENKEHSFPKRFRYTLQHKDRLQIIIDDGKEKQGERFIFDYRRR